MPKFRKKPVVIEASLWTKNGDHPLDDSKTIMPALDGEPPVLGEGKIVRRFRRPDVPGENACRHCGLIMHVHGWIDTLEGGHVVCPGDMVITGVNGEMYSCKPDIFAKTYDKVEE